MVLCCLLASLALQTRRARRPSADVANVSLTQPSRFLPPAAPLQLPAGALTAAPVPQPVPAAASVEIPEIDEIMTGAIRRARTPGAVVVVGRRDGVVFRRAYGHRAILPRRTEMTVDTVFDLASLTKPLVVGTLAQWLVERGELRLADRVSTYLPEFGARGKAGITVEQLLLHTSGLPPTNPLRDYKGGPENARRSTLGSWLFALPGRQFIYSDVGYIALGELIERVMGERLDRSAARVIWKPLRMSDTRYCPSMCRDARIAPTELAHGWRKSPILGEVQDPRAHRLGGIAGNAGVFSTADDLARFARMLLREGELDGARLLSAESVAQLMLPRQVPLATRALGWDVLSGFSLARGHELSARAVGHGGYTGTSLWIDPVLDVFVIFLSNRNHPYGTGKVTDLQGQVADAAVRALRPEALRQATLELGLQPSDVAGGAAGALPVQNRNCRAGEVSCGEASALRDWGG